MRLPVWAVLVMVSGSLVLENSTVAQAQEESGLTEGDIAKIQASIELVRNTLEAFTGLPTGEKALLSINLVSKLLQIVSSCFEVYSAFNLPSTQDIIKAGFGKVNLKLDALSLQLQKVGEELESDIEFHSWFSIYTDSKFKIMNGEEKLNQTMSQMEVATDLRQKLLSAKEFTDHYKSQDIEEAMRNIFRLTARDSTDTQPNLFQVYNKQHDCNIEGLSQFMFTIVSVILSGSNQMSAFSQLTNRKLATESLAFIHDGLENTKHQYEKQVWSCFQSAIVRAQKKTIDIMTHNQEMTGTQLSSKIHSELSALVPWYKWSVAHYEYILDFWRMDLPLDYVRGNCRKDIDFQRGQQVFLEHDNERKILVMWEDIDNESHECHQITEANTFMPLRLCEKCNADALQTSNDTLTGERCPNYIQSTYSHLCSDPMEWIHDKLKHYSFVAVGIERFERVCQKSTCGGHGSCRNIPYTNHHICLCHQYFFGQNCEIRYNPADSLLFRDAIAKVRSNFGNLIGVPNVIDVYIQMQKFGNQLQNMQNMLMGSLQYNRKLILYGKSFVKAERVAEKYSLLLSGNISEKNFGNDLEKHDLDFKNILGDMETMILGEGRLLSEGLFTSLKKSQSAAPVCNERYKEMNSRFMDDILLLDEAVTEAQLRFLNWKLRNKDPSEEQNLLHETSRIRDMAAVRQKNYVQHWEKNSCPELSAENLIENGCTKSLSYEGMRVKLTCSKRMTPSVSNVICQRVKGKLEWSAKPICQYVWGTWSSWSACSKTCGGGQRIRTRQKLNGERDTETQSCETQDCCQQKYGKFKCNNGQCVYLSSVCDGILNCNDWSDESEARQCNYLRDGDTVALKNGCGGFMSCCEKYFFRNDIITTSNCPGDSVDRNDWARCSNIEFRVDLINKGRHRGPIRFGDEIKITSKRSGVCTNCQHHSYYWMLFRTGRGNVCRATEATDDRCKTKIFARNRLGSCDGNVGSGCKGHPIRQGDVLYFRQGNTWISGDGVDKWVFRRTCPGNKITPWTPCRCEQWTVFRR